MSTTFKNGRIIFLADIHIDDYPNYNFNGPHSRLYQYLDFADRIIEITNLHQAGTIILGGDTLNKGVNESNIEHVVKRFLQKISQNGRVQVFHVLGQHDIKRKEKDLSIDSSFMNLWPEYTTYMDKQVISYTNPSGKTYTAAFRDWVPDDEADTFWDGYVDFFFAHVTNNPPFGQKINNEKFGIGIFGDIHQQSEYGNTINLGTPFYHHRLDEEQDGRYILLDLNQDKDNPRDCITYYPIDPTKKRFLKVKVVNEEIPEGKEYDPDTKTYHVFIPKLTIQEGDQTQFTELNFELSNDGISQMINDKFKDTELAHVHSIVSSSLTELPKPIDLNFRIMSLEIQNYRSIRHFKYEFGKSTAILGNHGSGKSTFINSIKLALTLGKITEKNISYGESYAEINLIIAYQSHLYTLCATSGTGAFAIDGEWQNVPAKQRLDLAKSYMPFLNYTDLFMFGADDRALLSAMNDDRKSDIISKIYNIDILNYLHDKAVELAYEKKQVLKDKESEVNSKNAVISHLRTSISKTYLEKSLVELRTLLDSRQASLKELEDNQALFNSYINLVNSNKSIRDSINTIESSIAGYKSSYDAELINKDSYESGKKTADANLKVLEYQRTLRITVSQEYERLGALCKEIDDITNAWKSELSSPPTVCPECGAPLSEDKVNKIIANINARYQKAYNEKRATYDKALAEYQNLLSEQVTIEDELNWEVTQKENFKIYSEKLANITLLYNTIQSLEGQLPELRKKINSKLEDELREKVKKLNLKWDDSLTEKVKQLSMEVATLDKIYKDCEKLYNLLGEVKSLTQETTELNNEIDLYNRYIESVSNTSHLYQSILQVIADKFSNEQYKLTVSSYQYRGSMRLSIQMSYKVGKYWIEYPELSTAQKCFCDIYFLSNLLKDTGALILDEYFANVNSSAMVGMMETLRYLNVGTLILSSHHDGLVVDGDVLKFDLIGNESKITKL